MIFNSVSVLQKPAMSWWLWHIHSGTGKTNFFRLFLLPFAFRWVRIWKFYYSTHDLMIKNVWNIFSLLLRLRKTKKNFPFTFTTLFPLPASWDSPYMTLSSLCHDGDNFCKKIKMWHVVSCQPWEGCEYCHVFSNHDKHVKIMELKSL